MVVIAMVVEVMIEKWGLIECMQYEKFAPFCNSILHMVTLTQNFHNTSLFAKVQGRQSKSIVNNSHKMVTGIQDFCDSCTRAFPDVAWLIALLSQKPPAVTVSPGYATG